MSNRGDDITQIPNAELGRLHRENQLLGEVLNRAVLLLESVTVEAQASAIRDVLAQAKSLGIRPVKTADLFRLPLAEAAIAYAEHKQRPDRDAAFARTRTKTSGAMTAMKGVLPNG